MMKGLILSCFLLAFGFILNPGQSTKVENFTLEDYNGQKHTLTDYKDSKAIVVMFIATQCPVSNSYNDRMNELYNEYHGKGVAFIAINSNKGESVEEIKNHATEHGFKFTVLKDWKNVVADKFGATVTPEIYVLNDNLEVLYHGRIDNSSKTERVTSRDLKNALDDILTLKPIAVTSTKAFGCTIKKVD